MWKYITRNVRETFERRICTSLTDTSGQDKAPCKFQEKFLPCLTNIVCGNHNVPKYNDEPDLKVSDHINQAKKCGNHEKEKTQQGSWHSGHHHIGHSWLNALGWSTALVLSWNLLQPLCRLRFSDKEQKCPFSKGPPHFMCWRSRGAHPRIFTRHWPFYFRQSHVHQDEYDGIWPINYDTNNFQKYQGEAEGRWDYKYTPPDSHAFRDEHDAKCNEEYYSKEHKSEDFVDHPISYESSYSSLWKVLSNTVFAQPTHVLPIQHKFKVQQEENKNQFKERQIEKEFGPPTAEQALDAAANSFAAVQNSVLGDIDNRLGVELMQNGRHHEAVSLFSRAVEMDHAAAAYNLGVCHEMGLGTNQDFKEAAKYYRLASKQGHATATYNLGVFHVHGWGGLAADCTRAHELFQRASQLGQPDAQKALAMVEGPPARPDTDRTVGFVQQALDMVQKIGLARPDESKHSELLDVDIVSSDHHKDISEMVHNSILKYTEMLQQ